MDAPLPSPDALVRPWRTATLVASLVAAIELVLLVVAALLLLAKPLAHAVRHHAEATFWQQDVWRDIMRSEYAETVILENPTDRRQ